MRILRGALWGLPVAAALAWHAIAAAPPARPSEPPRIETPPRAAGSAHAAATPPARATPAVASTATSAETHRAHTEAVAQVEHVAGPRLPGVQPGFPPALPARFGEPAVYDALTQALSDLGGTITKVDCREFPCLFLGADFGTREEADVLRQSPQLSAYADDQRAVVGWSEGPDAEGRDRRRFAVAIYPRTDDAHDREQFARIGYRVDQLRKSQPHE